MTDKALNNEELRAVNEKIINEHLQIFKAQLKEIINKAFQLHNCLSSSPGLILFSLTCFNFCFADSMCESISEIEI